MILTQVCMVNSAAFHTFLCHSKVLGDFGDFVDLFVRSSMFIVFLFHTITGLRRQRQPGILLITVASFLPSLVSSSKRYFTMLLCSGTYIRIIITTLRCFPEERLAHLTIVFLLFGTVIAIKYRPGSAADAKVGQQRYLPSKQSKLIKV